MINLMKFGTEAEYNQVKSGLSAPNVSYVDENSLVWILQQSASLYEFVDIGLSVKWATCNVGAEKPWDYGMYFAWGETDGYYVTSGSSGLVIKDKDGNDTSVKSSGFYWGDYKWCNGSHTSMTKYCTDSFYGTVDNKTVLEQSDDAAYVSDNTCRMPTYDELKEFKNSTTSEWTTDYKGSGVSGVIFTSKEDTSKSIFVPAAGLVSEGSLNGVGSVGYLLSGSLYEFEDFGAESLFFDSSNVMLGYVHRCYGLPVRVVQDK